ncbi:MAG TPA: hypothetical protein VIF09_05575, partial [Polyangiaceae bacterium]
MWHRRIPLPVGVLLAGSTALLMAGACSSGSSKASGGGTDASTDSPSNEGGSSGGEAGVDPTVGERASCTFQPGAKVADTIGDSNLVAAQKKIAHVIVMMKENRSFDEILAGLAAAGKTGVELPPAGWSNPDPEGGTVPV